MFECVVLILTVVLIVMFFYKYLVAYNLTEEISANPKKFHNLQYAAYWDEVRNGSILKGPSYEERFFIKGFIFPQSNRFANSPRCFLFQLYAYFMGLVVFLSTIKFIKILTFNKNMALLTSTLSFATWPILQVNLSVLTDK